MYTFITTLAYIFGTFATLRVVARIIAACTYSETQKMIDTIDGVKRSFPVTWPGILAIICWVWIFTT